LGEGTTPKIGEASSELESAAPPVTVEEELPAIEDGDGSVAQPVDRLAKT
jgi:hypothetical protein